MLSLVPETKGALQGFFRQSLVPLLDDKDILWDDEEDPGNPWRVCDMAAQTISVLLGWQEGLEYDLLLEDKAALIAKIKQWAEKNR